MSTTQHSEGINAFFDGYINLKTTLQQFVKQYDNALQQKAEKEYEADFSSLNGIIPCDSQSILETQFQDKYTHVKFKEVQAEFRAKINCLVANVSSVGSIRSYEIMEERIIDQLSLETTFFVSCTCRILEVLVLQVYLQNMLYARI
ncbi:hypothetical protein VNO78_01975 [Psophocarpus tetragonolobus]|uniref:Protein FAR1-RELATED SEQUENCE n=1 Tax=Psophocarpus tetragonolobus TaxID=3891 RepID=A0AAN9XUJ0_PSOTE